MPASPPPVPRPRVLIADDHVMVAEGLLRLLEEDFTLCDVVKDGRALVESVRSQRPDVVVADISMPLLSGIEALRTLREEDDAIPFVFLTMHGEPALAAEALRLGALGYVLKTAAGDELVHALHEALAGRTHVSYTLGAQAFGRMADPRYTLTDKQLQVLALVALGLRSKQIAYELGLSVRTVESHKYAIMQSLDVHNTVELVRKAEQSGLVPPATAMRSG